MPDRLRLAFDSVTQVPISIHASEFASHNARPWRRRTLDHATIGRTDLRTSHSNWLGPHSTLSLLFGDPYRREGEAADQRSLHRPFGSPPEEPVFARPENGLFRRRAKRSEEHT